MEQPSSFEIMLKKAWPYIYRAFNGTIFFLFFLLLNGFKRAISQIRGSM